MIYGREWLLKDEVFPWLEDKGLVKAGVSVCFPRTGQVPIILSLEKWTNKSFMLCKWRRNRGDGGQGATFWSKLYITLTEDFFFFAWQGFWCLAPSPPPIFNLQHTVSYGNMDQMDLSVGVFKKPNININRVH